MATLLVIGGMALQGCAGNATVDYAPGAAPTAETSSATSKVVTRVTDQSSFEAVRAAVEKGMAAGGRYSFVSQAGRQTVDTRFGDMQTLFSQGQTVATMSEQSKGQLLDDENAINEVLARYDANRRICTRETPVGTHFPTTVCRTLGEIRREQERGSQFQNYNNQLQNQRHEAQAVGASNGHP
ncbi:MAG TPA: hypothetical protein VF264_04155 [Rhodanobacteraceae bacterium]